MKRKIQIIDVPKNASHWKHQEGGTATGKNDQVMQMIQMFAQYVAQQSGKDPNQVYQELMQQLQQLKPEEQQAAIAQIAEQVQALQQQSQGQEQVAAQGQEQENPQEQVQEQSQEEEPMEYGGTPEYPYGGAISNNKYFRADPNVLPNNKFNNTLVNGNMLGSPYFSPIGTLSSIDAAPAQGLAMGLGAISSILGSAAGYSALTSKLFGKKNHAQGYQNYFQGKDNQVQNAKMPNFNSNPPASTPRANESIYPNKQNDIWNQFQKQKDPYANWKPGMQTPDVPAAPMAPMSQVGPQDMYNPAAPTSGASMNKLNGAPVMTMQKYGGLPHAQFGFFNFSDPYGLNNNAFGQTANYADTQGYASSKAAAARLAPAGNIYNRPGFVDGMGMGQEGYDYGYSTTQLPIMGPQDLYDPNKPISGASTNMLNGNTPAIKTQAGSFPSYASTINPNSVNTNNKTIKNSNPYRVSGDQIAMNSIIGANAFNFGLGWFNEKKQRNANFNHLADALSSNDISFVNNPREVHGNYTPNVQGGAPSLQVDKYTTPQDYGTGNSKYGGQQNFQSGGQYKVSHEELLQLLRDGAEIDFL